MRLDFGAGPVTGALVRQKYLFRVAARLVADPWTFIFAHWTMGVEVRVEAGYIVAKAPRGLAGTFYF